MPTLTHNLDPWLAIPPTTFQVDDWDDACESALEAEDWVHQTSDTDVGTVETILMWDEGSSTFYLYVSLLPLGYDAMAPQVDTFFFDKEA